MMRLKFLQTVESSAPGFPFQAGQTIHVSKLTAEMRQWVKDGRAVVLPEIPETPAAPEGERAVLPRAKDRHVR